MNEEIFYQTIAIVGSILGTAIPFGAAIIRKLDNLCTRVAQLEGRHLESDNT